MQVIMNGGPNALFAAFLYWQYMEQRKRGDAREKRAEEREPTDQELHEIEIDEISLEEDFLTDWEVDGKIYH